MLPKAEKVSYRALLSMDLSRFLMKTLPTPDFLSEGSLCDHMILIGFPFTTSKFMVSRALSARKKWRERSSFATFYMDVYSKNILEHSGTEQFVFVPYSFHFQTIVETFSMSCLKLRKLHLTMLLISLHYPWLVWSLLWASRCSLTNLFKEKL